MTKETLTNDGVVASVATVTAVACPLAQGIVGPLPGSSHIATTNSSAQSSTVKPSKKKTFSPNAGSTVFIRGGTGLPPADLPLQFTRHRSDVSARPTAVTSTTTPLVVPSPAVSSPSSRLHGGSVVRRRQTGQTWSALKPIEDTLLQRRKLLESYSEPALPGLVALFGNTDVTAVSAEAAVFAPSMSKPASGLMLAREKAPSSPLPAALLDKLVHEHGWRKLPPAAIWARLSEELTSACATFSKTPSVTRDRMLHERLQLFEALQRKGLPQSLGALCFALTARFGGVDEAYALLDVGGRGSGLGVTMLEFAGGLALLGFDAPTLCGFGEPEVLRRMDADSDGWLSSQDFRRSVKTFSGGSVSLLSNTTASVSGCEYSAWWVLIAKFVALSAWFYTPPHLRKRPRPTDMHADLGEEIEISVKRNAQVDAVCAAEAAAERAEGSLRHATLATEQIASALAESRTNPPSPTNSIAELLSRHDKSGDAALALPSRSILSGAAAVTARAAAAGGGARTTRPNARVLALDSVRRYWAPNELDYDATVQAMHVEFTKLAHVEWSNGEQRGLLCRQDFYRLVSELEPPGAVVHPGLSRLTCGVVGRIYDEALDVQMRMTATTDGRPCSKGLTFRSFQMCMLRVARHIGLHFRNLVDDALDNDLVAVADLVSAAARRGAPPVAASSLQVAGSGSAPMFHDSPTG
eukprot:TRINITY_DN30452_c0_g1_i1.p1 TRINITY_DN30452_c0_g1~~TRINITY_DN30452_c0_g1_i1.p1  ORF type:complete len:695 (+),score=97.33 TRINITY_DN30452_c0_g1_i1:90-2174(+)